MDKDMIALAELTQGWENLLFTLKKNKKIDFTAFEEVFSKTYGLLSQSAAEPMLDKKYVAMIAKAYLFANSENKELDNKCQAILALTERMLACCAFRSTPAVCEGATIYVFELRKDVHILFNDVPGAVETLEKLFKENGWRNM